MNARTSLPDLTSYSRIQLLELVGILHTGYVQSSACFDEAIALLRGRPNDGASLTSEQGKAWRERAELAERENERLHALVEELREALIAIRDETKFMDNAEMPIASMRGAALFAHGKADYVLAKNAIGILPATAPLASDAGPAGKDGNGP